MSHIFDALQRSEAGRRNPKTAASVTVTELLEHAERQALLQWEAEADSADGREHNITEAVYSEVPQAMAPEDVARTVFAKDEAARDNEAAKVFDLFEAVETSPPEKSRLVSLKDKESPAAEAFRLLKVRLRHLRKDRPLKKVLITSTSPEEGKSFAAANLACTLASGTQEKVLLLDGDLRRPVQVKLFGAKTKSGICECIRGKRSLTSSIYRLGEAGIWLLPAGNAEGDPLEIIQSAKLPSLIEPLTEWFDWIIIDSPPALPLADAIALARLADGILLVARRNVTQKRRLRRGLEAFESHKLLGALLNSSDNANDKDYYYYRHETAAPAHPEITLH